MALQIRLLLLMDRSSGFMIPNLCKQFQECICSNTLHTVML